MTMGQRIAEQRKRLGLSLEALGEKLEVSRQAVSKWEADGAVPGIDKLIAMSKFFGVSVGWLLGVEEQAGEKQEVASAPVKENLSEDQLKLIEDIVAKYQAQPHPAKKQSKLPWIFSMIVGLLAVVLAVMAMDKANARDFNYDTQLNNLSNNYANLQNQLGEVSEQLDELAQGERLLTDHSVTAVAAENMDGAVVAFSGTPRAWRAEDIAYISARFEGQEVQRAECTWDGNRCTANLELPPRDGYRYYYILTHTDGTQEQQRLQNVNHYAENVAEGLSCIGFVEVPVIYDDGELTLFHTLVDVAVPPLMEAEETLCWTEAVTILYKNGQEVSRQDLLAGTDMNDDVYDGGSYLSRMEFWEIEEIALEDEDEVSVEIMIRSNTGIVISQQIYSGVREGNSYKETVASELYIQ